MRCRVSPGGVGGGGGSGVEWSGVGVGWSRVERKRKGARRKGDFCLEGDGNGRGDE